MPMYIFFSHTHVNIAVMLNSPIFKIVSEDMYTKHEDILGLTVAFLDFHLIKKALFMLSAINYLLPKLQCPACVCTEPEIRSEFCSPPPDVLHL